MTREEIAAAIVQTGLVPVIRASTAELALSAAEAVRKGGIPIVEITQTA